MKFQQVLSPFDDMPLWASRSNGYSFVISYDPKTGAGMDGWTGYNASWKNLAADMEPFGKQRANRIDGGPWQTFLEAELACKKTLKELRNKN